MKDPWCVRAEGINLEIKMNLSLDLKIRILNMVYSLILSLFNQLECPTWNFLQKIEVVAYFYVIKEKFELYTQFF